VNTRSWTLALLFSPACCWAAPTDPISDTTPIHDIMHYHVMPAAQVLWDATAIYITIKGEDDRSPKNDEEWNTVDLSRIALEEAIKALLVPGRVADIPEAGEVIPEGELKPEEIQALIKNEPELWVAMVHALDGTVQQAKRDIENHDVEALRETGGAIDDACEACHLHFWYPKN